jgi:hypothetical protein
MMAETVGSAIDANCFEALKRALAQLPGQGRRRADPLPAPASRFFPAISRLKNHTPGARRPAPGAIELMQ